MDNFASFLVFLGWMLMCPVGMACSLALDGLTPKWSLVVGTAIASLALVVVGSLLEDSSSNTY